MGCDNMMEYLLTKLRSDRQIGPQEQWELKRKGAESLTQVWKFLQLLRCGKIFSELTWYGYTYDIK